MDSANCFGDLDILINNGAEQHAYDSILDIKTEL
jgi:hypothetical protein